MADFSERLRDLRLKKGVSQQDIADYLGINKQTVSGYERGVRRPAGEGAIEVYEALADYFNVDIRYLMGVSDLSISMVNPLDIECHLTDDERLVIETYRRSSPEQQHLVKYALGIK